MKRKSYIYIQDCGTYDNEIIVAVNLDKEAIAKWMKKNKINKDLITQFSACEDFDDWMHSENYSGMMWADSEYRCVLVLPKWENKWESYDTLMHECLHVVQAILIQQRKMADESEAQAYQQEYLVKAIRRKLHKAFYG